MAVERARDRTKVVPNSRMPALGPYSTSVCQPMPNLGDFLMTPSERIRAALMRYKMEQPLGEAQKCDENTSAARPSVVVVEENFAKLYPAALLSYSHSSGTEPSVASEDATAIPVSPEQPTAALQPVARNNTIRALAA
jgi:hypothetical protein